MSLDSQFFIPITVSMKAPDHPVHSLKGFLTLFSPLLCALLRKHSLAKYKVFLSKRSDAFTQTQFP